MIRGTILSAIIALSFILAVSDAWAEGLLDCYKAQDAQEGGDPALAIDYYTRCIAWGGQTREDMAVMYNNRGIAYADQGEYDRAIRDYEEAIRLDPSYASRGLAHLKRGDQDLAVQAVRFDPGFADAPYGEALTTRNPQSIPSMTGSPPATQALEIATAGVPETDQRSFAIHLASFRTKDRAETGWNNLQRQFPELIGQRDQIIRSVEVEAQGAFFRIMTGPFEARSRAQDLCGEFESREQYCMVLRLTEPH